MTTPFIPGFKNFNAWAPHPTWCERPRVRVDTLKKGDMFVAIDGCQYTYDRVDGACSGVHHVIGDTDEKTSFAGCAEVVKMEKRS